MDSRDLLIVALIVFLVVGITVSTGTYYAVGAGIYLAYYIGRTRK